MAEENKNTCYDCEYFTDGIGKNGYCSLYRHNISLPEKICSKFEKKKKDQTVLRNKESFSEEASRKSEFKYKYDRHLSYFIGIISAFVLVIAFLIFDILFVAELHSHMLPLPVKLGSIAVLTAVFLIYSWQLFMFLRKFRWAFIPYLIIAITLILLIVLDFGNVWLTVNNRICKIIEYVFYGL